MAIRYTSCRATRNEETIAKLRELADGQPMEPVVVIDRAVARIATEMRRIHGGEWRTVVDHERLLVLVRPL